MRMLMLIAASFKGTVVPGCDGGARAARRWPPIMIEPQAAADKRCAGLAKRALLPVAKAAILPASGAAARCSARANDATGSETRASDERPTDRRRVRLHHRRRWLGGLPARQSAVRRSG